MVGFIGSAGGNESAEIPSYSLHIAIPRVDARVIGYSSRQYAMAVFSFPATLRVIRRANSILVYPSTISAFQGLYKWGSEQVCA